MQAPFRNRPQSSLPAPLLGVGAVALLTAGAAVLVEDLQHWFLLPVSLCGLLLADQAVKWLRGQLDLMDPAGLLAALGLHFFVFAPLLHVYWQRFMPWVEPPADWRDWLGAMAALNALGLVLYRAAGWSLGRRARLGRGETESFGSWSVLRAEVTKGSDLTPSDLTPLAPPPSDQPPSDQTPSDQMPSDQTPSDQTPSDQTPSDQTPSDQTPSDQTPSDQTPSDQTPSDQIPSDLTPSEQRKAAPIPQAPTPPRTPPRVFPPPAPKVLWQLDSTRFALVLSLGTLFTLVLQSWLLARFGGLSGIIHAYSNPESRSAAFVGLGWVLMFSESFPVLLLFAFVVLGRRYPELRSWGVIAAFLLLFLALQLLFGGLRGSRSNTVWALFWAGGLVHLLLRPIPRKLAAIGLLALMGFMYSYGFYKSFGSEALVALEGSEERAELVERSGRGLDAVLLGDLARADIQAFILYRQGRPDIGWQPALGRTYLGALALFIPRQIWPDRPPTKVKEGTEIQYGPGLAYFANYQSSRVYGLAGEAMLNFGPWGVPFAFLALGLLLRWVKGRLSSWSQSGDSRILMAPLLVNLCFVTLGSDLDNLLFFMVKNGFFPFLVVVLSSRRLKIRAPIAAPRSSPRIRAEAKPLSPAFEPARGVPWS